MKVAPNATVAAPLGFRLIATELVEVEMILTLFELRLLSLLGYVRTTKTLAPILEEPATYEKLLAECTEELLAEANDALVMGREVSHL